MTLPTPQSQHERRVELARYVLHQTALCLREMERLAAIGNSVMYSNVVCDPSALSAAECRAFSHKQFACFATQYANIINLFNVMTQLVGDPVPEFRECAQCKRRVHPSYIVKFGCDRERCYQCARSTATFQSDDAPFTYASSPNAARIKQR